MCSWRQRCPACSLPILSDRQALQFEGIIYRNNAIDLPIGMLYGVITTTNEPDSVVLTL
jgi:hypothetical protein